MRTLKIGEVDDTHMPVSNRASFVRTKSGWKMTTIWKCICGKDHRGRVLWNRALPFEVHLNGRPYKKGDPAL